MDMASAPGTTGWDAASRGPEMLHKSGPDRSTLEQRITVLDLAAVQTPAFRSQWDALIERASEPNAFFEPWFLIPGLSAWGHGARVTIKAFHVGGTLCALYPVVRSMRYYGYPVSHATGWLHANAFCGTPLVARGFEQAFWRSLLAHFDRSARRALFLHLPMLPEGGPIADALESVLAQQGRARHFAKRESRAMLASDLSPQAYFAASMNQKKRKELRRQHKRLGELGDLTFERREDDAGLDAWIAQFLALEAAGWKGEAGSALAARADTRRFFTETLKGAAAAGRLERLALRLDGKPVAMLANFLSGPGAFSFKTSFDEDHARFSPGMLLQLENLDLLARDGIEWADSCAVEGHSMIERMWREKRELASHNIAIGGRARRALFAALMAWENRKGESRAHDTAKGTAR